MPVGARNSPLGWPINRVSGQMKKGKPLYPFFSFGSALSKSRAVAGCNVLILASGLED
jgi:hypothetical protein